MEKLCIKDTCKRCDVGFIIKDYVRPLMQALSVHLEEYNMQLVETKCLNTAVMMMYLLFGLKALQHTRFCDVPNVVKRHEQGIDDSTIISLSMKKEILRKTKHRYIYYVMLTDGYFYKRDGSKVFFPGHVFLIEKVPWKGEMFYYIYQSYINEYTLEAQVAPGQKSMKISREKMEYYLSKICDMTQKKVWDEDFVKFWMDMTRVDTKHMLSTSPQNAFFVCFRKIRHESCVKELLRFSKFISKDVSSSLDKPDEVYGKKSTYFHEKSSPMTNKEIHEAFLSLRRKLEKSL